MSVITDDTSAEVEAYLAAVRATLSDLPPAERDDLLAEVESSLREAADDTGSIGTRLGSPAEFAAELRTAAGLHALPADASPPKWTERLGRLRSHPRAMAARRLAFELAPVWWVARGYVFVAGVAALAGSSWSTRYPLVPRLGNAEWGVTALVVAAIASVAAGLRTRHAHGGVRHAAIAANVLCVALLIPVAAQLGDGARGTTIVEVVREPFAPPGLAYNGAPVQNIYPYDLHGKLLHDVLLYDGAGNPIEVTSGVPDPNRRVLKTSSNTDVFNSFPIRYYEPGTVRVAHPNAAPRVEPPLILPSP
jgi:hypothetical protein